MIDKKELRIGNLVWEDYGGEYIVQGISPGDSVYLGKCGNSLTGVYPLERIKPLPVTEEILLKFGFGVHEDCDGCFVDNVSMDRKVLIYSTCDEVFEIECLSNTVQVAIKYVHQLQNIYFELTGKELEKK